MWMNCVKTAAVLAVALACGAPALAGNPKRDDNSEKIDVKVGDAARKAHEAYLKRDYKRARALFEKALEEGHDADVCHGYLARIAFFYGEDDVAREHLGKIESKSQYDEWLAIAVDGPYKTILGDAQRACEGKTPKGYYYLVTDVGYDKKEWDALKPQIEMAERQKNPKVRAAALAALKTEGWKEVAGYCDEIYEQYGKVFPTKLFPKDDKLVSRVFVMRERGDYIDFGMAIGNSREWLEKTAGYYTPFMRLLVVDASERGKKFKYMWQSGREVLFHEAFHQYIDYFIERCPTWFNEGLAMYFEEFTEDEKTHQLALGPVKKMPDATGDMTNFQIITGALQPTAKDPVLPLKQFTAGDTPDFYEKEKMYIRYAQGWSVIRFLVEFHPKGKKILLEYFKALKDGKSAEEAQAAAFKGEDFTRLEKMYRVYFQRLAEGS
ncbi:MAG TPA: hypothetical protein VHF22_08070 [Planctomycetota bacterium]|nr:hypothetical protein [Planctomycetota bacterium]